MDNNIKPIYIFKDDNDELEFKIWEKKIKPMYMSPDNVGFIFHNDNRDRKCNCGHIIRRSMGGDRHFKKHSELHFNYIKSLEQYEKKVKIWTN